MRRIALLLCLLCLLSLPAAAQDAARGKLLYETHCGGCHYERVHERNRDRTAVHSPAELRDQVALRAAQTGRPFTPEDLADIAEYLDRTHYRFGAGAALERELIYGAELMSADEREQYRQDVAAAGPGGQARVREQHRQRIRARAKSRGADLIEPSGIVRR